MKVLETRHFGMAKKPKRLSKPLPAAATPSFPSPASEAAQTRFKADAAAFSRKQVLVDWFKLDPEEWEKERKLSLRSIEDIVAGATRRLNLEQKQAEAEIIKVWSHVIDPAIRDRAHPTGLVRGTLFVTVVNHAWMDEIMRFRRKEILTLMQQSFGSGTIQRISFRVGGF